MGQEIVITYKFEVLSFTFKVKYEYENVNI